MAKRAKKKRRAPEEAPLKTPIDGVYQAIKVLCDALGDLREYLEEREGGALVDTEVEW
jgi:hypothetical protein